MLAGDLQYGVSNTLSLGVAHLRDCRSWSSPGWDVGHGEPDLDGRGRRSNSTIASGKDLTGKTVGGISLGGLDELAMRAYIDKGGGDWTTTSSSRCRRRRWLKRSRRGASWPRSYRRPNDGRAHREDREGIAGGYDAIAKQFLNTAWFGMRDFIAKDPDTTRRVASALIAGGQWAMANQVAAAGLIEKYQGFKEDRMLTRFGTKLEAASIQPCFDAASKYKLLSARVNAAEMVWGG